MVKSIVKTSIETTREGNVLVFDPSRTFGNKKTMGMQYKGSAVIDGKEQFVKLDVINPEVKGRWENHFDYENSSVTESIVGALVKNMDADPNFESVIYTFGEFQTPTRKFTGTYSENFLRENEIEMILSTSTQSDAHTTCSLDEYVESVIDTNPENRYNHLLSLFKEQNIDEAAAKKFLVQQAGFDILTGNRDRVNNPSNFIFAHNVDTGETRPINMAVAYE